VLAALDAELDRALGGATNSGGVLEEAPIPFSNAGPGTLVTAGALGARPTPTSERKETNERRRTRGDQRVENERTAREQQRRRSNERSTTRGAREERERTTEIDERTRGEREGGREEQPESNRERRPAVMRRRQLTCVCSDGRPFSLASSRE
jgi:hypothetical protein